MNFSEGLLLASVAVLGHVMAVFWMSVEKYEVDLSRDKIYDLPIKDPQVRRELKNSIHSPLHAIILGIALWYGAFDNRTLFSFVYSLALTALWAEIWHYFTHRAFHWKSLHWIHAEHHKSRLSSPFTALSFSLTEKLVFSIGIIGVLMIADLALNLNFYGVGGWFIVYLAVNSFGHANYEIRSAGYMKLKGKYITSTVYHALHHSRYTGNYGLATRLLDQWFGTEWPDSEAVYDQVVGDKKPMTSLRERAE